MRTCYAGGKSTVLSAKRPTRSKKQIWPVWRSGLRCADVKKSVHASRARKPGLPASHRPCPPPWRCNQPCNTAGVSAIGSRRGHISCTSDRLPRKRSRTAAKSAPWIGQVAVQVVNVICGGVTRPRSTSAKVRCGAPCQRTVRAGANKGGSTRPANCWASAGGGQSMLAASPAIAGTRCRRQIECSRLHTLPPSAYEVQPQGLALSVQGSVAKHGLVDDDQGGTDPFSEHTAESLSVVPRRRPTAAGAGCSATAPRLVVRGGGWHRPGHNLEHNRPRVTGRRGANPRMLGVRDGGQATRCRP